MQTIKCFWCKGKTKLGVHSKCWKVFSGWMLSDRLVADQSQIEYNEKEDTIENYQSKGDTYFDKSGRVVIEGRLLPTPNYDNQEL